MNSKKRKEKVVASKHGTHAIVILVHNVGNFNKSQMILHNLHVRPVGRGGAMGAPAPPRRLLRSTFLLKK